MPGARCTRGLVCKVRKGKRTRAYRFSGGNLGIPCAMALQLMARSPRRRIRLVTVIGELAILQARLGLQILRRLDTSNGCQDHTLLPYAATRLRQKAWPGYGAVVLRNGRSLTENRPANNLRADAAASTASPPAFVTIAIRPSCRERTGRTGSADLPDRLSGILPVGLFCRGVDASGRQGAVAPCPNRRPAIPEIAPRPDMPERCQTRRD
jgi:hypothetical protein